ncbi:hypothetical protein WDD9_006279 [Paenibacillus melissococcoides]|uniref:hypothetical protein n=1 Tax=Paenibacillus TaxID=44249 RepID=UPI001BD07DDF|nr:MULTISPECIES: hypothetical protein [Paenibacillus]MEB9895834.1 hypothetical protein [Bacillus cereus]CAH8721410.1 hypothetical protein WDD9_006279 [Paenibacillus melissococcoides]CAH8721810.1 hypothetical protein HTL2_006547 [Paenibacillus melissococcoides]
MYRLSDSAESGRRNSSRSGRKVMLVPVSRVAPTVNNPVWGMPCLKSCRNMLPPRRISTVSLCESAVTMAALLLCSAPGTVMKALGLLLPISVRIACSG